LRSEHEIFDELAGLCTSPGYVHAIAFLCFRDSIVRYQGEMTAEDVKHMFSPEHLVRTEISTLVGLLIKAAIDYSLPAPAVTQQYLERTEELLEETAPGDESACPRRFERGYREGDQLLQHG
jgi:hypothetical protein